MNRGLSGFPGILYPQMIATSLSTDRISTSTSTLTPKFAKANIAASTTDGAIISAVTGKKIRVLAIVFMSAATATTVTFNTKPGGSGTAISCAFATAANGGACISFCPVGWFETNSGEGLTATTGSGSTVGIQVVYVEV